MVEAASSRRSSIPWRIPRAKISVASARDGEDGDQSSYALGGSQQGGVSPTSKGVRPASSGPSPCVPSQPESSSRSPRPQPQQCVAGRGLTRDQG